MEKVLYRLNFNESNLNSQKTGLLRMLRESRRLKTAVSFNREFPPCILDEKHGIPGNETLALGRKSILLSNNLYFGEQYAKINRLFSASPFISGKCRSCKHSKSFLCRGIPNNKFLQQEKSIRKRLGSAEYEATRTEYENGIVAFGSICLQRCKLCYNDFFSPKILKKIPFLNTKEIKHFFHYLPRKIGGIGENLHCQRGDIMDSPFFEETMEVMKFFMEPGCTMDTRGYKISDKTAKILKKAKARIMLDTVYALDQKNIDKYVFGKKKIDYVKIINILKRHGVEYAVNLFPLKSVVASGDFFSAIDRLLANDKKCPITINDSSLMAPTGSGSSLLNREMAEEIISDFAGLKRSIKEKWPDCANFSFPISRKGLAMTGASEKNISEISNDGSCCLMVSEIDGEKRPNAIKVSSGLGFEPSFSKILTISDFIRATENAPKKCRNLAVPRSSFDADMRDVGMSDINDLWKKISDRFSKLSLY